MFRKPPLKTYRKKKLGGASSTLNLSSIVREDIPKSPELQPKEFLAFKDSDVSMEYDPFDTTFDRLVKDAKPVPPPVPPDLADDSSFSSSSSDTKKNALDEEDPVRMPDPLPLINPKPAKQSKIVKKQKLNKDFSTVKVTKLAQLLEGRSFRSDSSTDENTEPNFKQPKSGKRNRKKKPSSEPKYGSLKKKRRVAEKPAVSTYKGRKNDILDRSKSLKRCSVSLTRVSVPLEKSMADLHLQSDVFTHKKIAEKSGVSGSSKVETGGEFPAQSSAIIRNEREAGALKNPVVSLTRLKVPQTRESLAEKMWLNSTPIDRRIARPKSSLRFSPISNDKSMEKSNRRKSKADGSYDEQSLQPEKSVARSKFLSPKNVTKTPKFSNLSMQGGKNTNKSRPRLLSDSPDPEASGLMFEDTEISAPHAGSYVSLKENGNRDATLATTTSPFKGFSNQTAETSVEETELTSRSAFAPIGNYSEGSTASPFKGFTKESTDSGSLRLHLDGSDNTAASSREITRSLEENRMDVTDAKSFDKSARVEENSLEESTKNGQNILTKSAKDKHKIPSKSAEDKRDLAKSRRNILDEISHDWDNSSEENANDTSEKLNSDDEWATIPDSLSADKSSAKDLENTTADLSKRKSVVQVSSDENTSCDDIGEFVNASEISRRVNYGSQEVSSFETEENSKVEAIGQSKAEADESKAKADEMPVEEITHDKEINDERGEKMIDPRRVQPVVLLSRLSVPLRAPKRISSSKNIRMSSLSNTMKSILESSSESDIVDAEKSVNESEMSSELMEWDGDEKDESQESQDDMESLKIGENSGNTTEVEDSAIMEVSDRNLSKGSFRWSMNEVGNAGECSSKTIEIEDESRNDEESFEAKNVSEKKSPGEETTFTMLNRKDNRRSIQPVVLLNRLDDPIRVTDRRKKYRNWGLSAISEKIGGENVTTIEEEPEDIDVVDTAKSQNKKEEKKNRNKKEEMKNDPEQNMSTDEHKLSQRSTVSWNTSLASNEGNESVKEDKFVFLKPGKSWSRSLSLFRQVQSQDDIDVLAVGKGKKWRQSVQSILDMQQQGVIQSCVKKNEDDKESRSCYGARNSTAAWLSECSQPITSTSARNSTAAWLPGCSQPITSREFGQTSVGSPGRFVRRVSIRVVPDRKNSELYEDSPFLEAYGITTSENRKTLGKRSSLMIAPRKINVYNLHCEDVTFESIPRSLTSVTSRDVVLAQCGQDSSLPFDECYPDSYLKHCRKIGEGVFGEVFLYEKDAVRSVIKIIPIEGELKVNGERQKKFDEILSEIVIAKELNNLRYAETSKTSSFVGVKSIRCVVGKYPEMLLDLWNTFDNEKNSENDCPDKFDKNQLYIVLELEHGGQDLEAFVFQNSSEAHALFIQTALALAVAEESLEFEHRDLHWGNILISRTEDTQINYKLRNKDIMVASKGVKVSVIDFTLSRMSYQGCSIFNDLSLDDDLFAAQGEYQFEIYRLMRRKVQNNWQTFEPYTNVLWLHYTLDKMITAVRYRRPTSKIHKSGITKLKELKNEILDYNSASDFVTSCDNVTRLQGSRSSV